MHVEVKIRKFHKNLKNLSMKKPKRVVFVCLFVS